MVPPHCGNRRLAVLVIAFGTSIAVLSCASPREGAQNRSSSSSAAATSGESDGGYDISRIAEVEDDFPPGFTPRWFPLHVLNEEQATSVGEVVYGEPSTVDPPQCASVLKPVHATAGTESVGFRADGPQGQMSVGADRFPVSVRVDIPSVCCDRTSYTVEKLRQSGTVERIGAPDIDGATTTALKIQIDGADKVDYYHIAFLGDRVSVDLRARVDPNFQAEPFLSDLFGKAVAAVRGR
jgi:hypothetical protein